MNLLLVLLLTGYDFLGLAKLDAIYIAKHIKPNSSIGVLFDTFGNPITKLKIILNTDKIQIVRVHLVNATINNHRCQNFRIKIKRNLRHLAEIIFLYPNIEWIISPVLEHGCKDSAFMNAIFREIRKSKLLVSCSTYKGYCPRNTIIERHGINQVAEIVSNDGSISSNPHNKGALNLYWHPCMNGRTGNDFIPVSQRTAYCTHKQLDLILNNH